MPDEYASNLRRYVNLNKRKLFGMKSHDCHVLREMLLPIAFRALPHQVWNPIAELSKFFKDLCSTILRVDDLLLMEKKTSSLRHLSWNKYFLMDFSIPWSIYLFIYLMKLEWEVLFNTARCIHMRGNCLLYLMYTIVYVSYKFSS